MGPAPVPGLADAHRRALQRPRRHARPPGVRGGRPRGAVPRAGPGRGAAARDQRRGRPRQQHARPRVAERPRAPQPQTERDAPLSRPLPLAERPERRGPCDRRRPRPRHSHPRLLDTVGLGRRDQVRASGAEGELSDGARAGRDARPRLPAPGPRVFPRGRHGLPGRRLPGRRGRERPRGHARDRLRLRAHGGDLRRRRPPGRLLAHPGPLGRLPGHRPRRPPALRRPHRRRRARRARALRRQQHEQREQPGAALLARRAAHRPERPGAVRARGRLPRHDAQPVLARGPGAPRVQRDPVPRSGRGHEPRSGPLRLRDRTARPQRRHDGQLRRDVPTRAVPDPLEQPAGARAGHDGRLRRRRQHGRSAQRRRERRRVHRPRHRRTGRPRLRTEGAAGSGGGVWADDLRGQPRQRRLRCGRPRGRRADGQGAQDERRLRRAGRRRGPDVHRLQYGAPVRPRARRRRGGVPVREQHDRLQSERALQGGHVP